MWVRLPDCSNATLSPQGAHLHPSRRWSLPTGVQGFSSGIPGLSRGCSSAGLSHHTFPPWSQDTFTFPPLLPDISASCRLSGPCPPLPSGHLQREMTSSRSCCQVCVWMPPFHRSLRILLAALWLDCTMDGDDSFRFNTPFIYLLPCWIFTAAEATAQLQGEGASVCLWCAGLSCCRARPLAAVPTGSAAPQHRGSSHAMGRNGVPALAGGLSPFTPF